MSSMDDLVLPYSVLHGYAVPDSEDGLDDFDIVDPSGLAICPFVRIPYDHVLDESHFLEDSLKNSKRKIGDNREGTDIGKKEKDGPLVKKIRKEDEGKLEGGVADDIDDENISLPNLILGILCPKYKEMPEYRVPEPSFKEKREEKKRKAVMEEMKRKEELEEMKNKVDLEEKENEENINRTWLCNLI